MGNSFFKKFNWRIWIIKRYYILILSLLLVLGLIIWIGPLKILNALKTADWWLILLALFIHLTVMLIRSIRWGFIIDQTTEFKKNFIVTNIGSLQLTSVL